MIDDDSEQGSEVASVESFGSLSDVDLGHRLLVPRFVREFVLLHRHSDPHEVQRQS